MLPLLKNEYCKVIEICEALLMAFCSLCPFFFKCHVTPLPLVDNQRDDILRGDLFCQLTLSKL